MLVIRLFRVGKLNQPFFKIVVTEKKHAARAGRFVEEVGFYNPLTKEKGIKADRVKYWLGVGAQASDTVHNLFVSEKIIEDAKKKINITKSKKEKSAEEPVKPVEKPTEQASVEGKTKEPKEEIKPAEKPEEVNPAPKKISKLDSDKIKSVEKTQEKASTEIKSEKAKKKAPVETTETKTE